MPRATIGLLLTGLSFALAQPVAAQNPAAAPRSATASEAAQPHLDYALRQLVGPAASLSPAELRRTNPDMQLGQGPAGATVLVRVLARDVAALLPALRARGFAAVGSAPALHLVEGWLPVGQLAGTNALVKQGLLGIIPCWAPATSSGLVTSQGDYVLEARRARATAPARVTGSGVRVGVISNSFNKKGQAAADITNDDLPSTGVQVLRESLDPTADDEGRAMCQIVHDLAPGAALAFCTAGTTETTMAQSIRDLADPSRGNCRVVVDDIGYPEMPMFQDGVSAQAVTYVVTTWGAAYFSAASNLTAMSYENNAPQFIAGAGGRYLNFAPAGATPDVTQRIIIPAGSTFKPCLQWSDPFFSVDGVRTNLDIFLVAVASGVAPDTVARSTRRNIRMGIPSEFVPFTNDVSQTGTTTFDLVITLRQGQVPGRLKYINRDENSRAVPAEYDTQSSTITGHAAAAEAFAVAAVPYYNQRAPESFTSKGGALPFLFAPDSTALPTPALRQKPNGAATDAGNNTVLGNDLEGDGFPNFAGTSAAAPHAAAVAALLRAAEPTLTPAQVYGRLAGSARPLGSGPLDPLTGPGVVDAFTTLYGPVVAVAPPIAEGFEQGALPTSWLVYGTGAARVQDTTLVPATGLRSLVLDAEPAIQNARFTALTEATLRVRATASAGSLTLSFRARKFVAETDEPMPLSFQGHDNSDGVALSVDAGATWYRVADLTGANATTTYQTKTINLSQFASANGLALGNDVRLRFQRYGLGGVTNPAAPTAAGRVFDDIVVSGAVLSASAAASPAELEAWPVPAPGGSALHLRLPAFSGPAQVQLLDNLDRVLWQRQLAGSGKPWEGTLPLPATAGLYHLRYQPAGAPSATRRVVVQ